MAPLTGMLPVTICTQHRLSSSCSSRSKPAHGSEQPRKPGMPDTSSTISHESAQPGAEQCQSAPAADRRATRHPGAAPPHAGCTRASQCSAVHASDHHSRVRTSQSTTPRL